MSLRGYWRTVTRADRLQPGDQDHQVDDDREHRPADEQVGELHQLSSGVGAGLVARLHLVVDEHRGAVAQLEGARADHLLARLDAGEHGDLVAAARRRA